MTTNAIILDILNALAIGMGAAVAIMAVIDWRSGVRRYAQAVVGVWFVLVYSYAALPGMTYFVRSGMATRLGVILALFLLITEINATRQSRKNAN